jgi:ribosomal protein S18 acetylase RimI-like enzyme
MRMIRKLGEKDAKLLAGLAREDEEFDLEGRSGALTPLGAKAAKAYLSDPQVLHWVEEVDGMVVGFLYCAVVRLRSGDALELLLYEIGVRKAWRRKGAGSRLMKTMFAWMRKNAVKEVWVLADNPVAVKFYKACKFRRERQQPTYMTASA